MQVYNWKHLFIKHNIFVFV